MYYAFDISMDMSLANETFKKISAFLSSRGNKKFSIVQSWIHSQFVLDNNLLEEFGRCKIKEAQGIDTTDRELRVLKE